MERDAYKKLLAWKGSPSRKPLIIRGARQVGKTWLMKAFAANEYENYVYINFEANKHLQNLFDTGFSVDRILLAFQIETGVTPQPGRTLIILDEIQEAAHGITALKYFYENVPEHHVMAAGSYLGVSLHNNSSFPVGKVDFLNLWPLTFTEFLNAMGQDKLVNLLENQQWDIVSTFKQKYIERLKQYYFLGGMPEVVKQFLLNNDFNEARAIQKAIIEAYEQDFSKHATINLLPRLRMVWNSVPAQLAKENKKFIFGLLKKGSRAKDFELALEWLSDSGLITCVKRISKPGIPLKAYEDFNAYKVFLNDVGLLGALAGLDSGAILSGNTLFSEFKGALTEQYVFQQLAAKELYYWSAEKSSGEIDFVLQVNNKVVALEVKAEENLKAKSLKNFYQKYAPPFSVRTSMSDFRDQGWLINIPLYGISTLEKMVK